jgi:hypothetical protein
MDIAVNNCIIYGNQVNEMTLDFLTGSILNYAFSNCLIRTDANTSTPEFVNCLINQNPSFVNTTLQDYHLAASSICIGAANFTGGLTTDLDNNPRDGSPDIGCYEFQ